MKDRGSAPLELAAAVGLLLIPAVLLVLSFAPWVERQMMAREIARNVARTAAATAEFADTGDLVTRAALNYGVDREDVTVTLGGSVGRGGLVTATVDVRMPAIVIPGVGEFGSVTWTVHHTEQVDPYRSYP
ncbi:MAG: hypothetical protein GXP34_01825 [Actinobacteria bacterium]|nr:hypothetical protein [Actinomycetota bacterium]